MGEARRRGDFPTRFSEARDRETEYQQRALDANIALGAYASVMCTPPLPGERIVFRLFNGQLTGIDRSSVQLTMPEAASDPQKREVLERINQSLNVLKHTLGPSSGSASIVVDIKEKPDASGEGELICK